MPYSPLDLELSDAAVCSIHCGSMIEPYNRALCFKVGVYRTRRNILFGRGASVGKWYFVGVKADQGWSGRSRGKVGCMGSMEMPTAYRGCF